MSMDPGVGEGAPQIPTTIDFDLEPAKIERYQFGQPVNRDNFTSFLIDSFAKSRNNDSVQAYYWKYVANRTGFDVTTTIDTFIDEGALMCLSSVEREMFDSAYEAVKKHQPVPQWETRNDTSFNNGLSETLDYANRILKNEGKIVKFRDKTVKYENMDPKVLKMEPEKFLDWITTEGQKSSLYKQVF